MTPRIAWLAVALAASTVARAQDTPNPTPDPKEAASLQSFAADHPDCKEWSDGCAVCTRETGVKCSLPGIACQPEPIACKAP